MMCHNQNVDLVNTKCIYKICPFVLKKLNRNEILCKLRAITLVQMCRKMMYNNPTVDLVKLNMNAFIKFGEILSICSQDDERKQNFDLNQGPLLW